MVTKTLTDGEAQRALEAKGADVWRRVARGELPFEEAMRQTLDWELQIGDDRFLLYPPTGEWLVHDRLHDSWEPLGLRAGDRLLTARRPGLGEVTEATGSGTRPETGHPGEPGLKAAIETSQKPIIATLDTAEVVPCPRCGTVEHTGGRFCANRPEPAGEATCRNCGRVVTAEAASCSSCGSRVSPARGRRRPGIMGVLRILSIVGGLALTGLGIAGAVTGADPLPPAFVADPDPATTTPAPQPATTLPQISDETAPLLPATATCINEVVGFSVEYPIDWYVAGTDLDGPCAFFNPEPFEVSEASERPVAIAIYQTDWPFDDLAASYETEGAIVDERWAMEVGGRRAQRILYTFTDDGFEPGISGYDVLVEHGAATLVITTFEPFTTDFDATRRLVDTIAAGLELDPPSEP